MVTNRFLFICHLGKSNLPYVFKFSRQNSSPLLPLPGAERSAACCFCFLKKKMADINAFFRFVTCVLGIVVSLYALHVEVSKFEDKDFKAMCDISEAVSCSKVFTSKCVYFTVFY